MTTRPTRFAEHDGVSIAYETFGDLEQGEPLLLIMGLDFQMIWWPDEFCELLVEAGYAVVRFDNRDTGLSTHFDSPRTQNPWRALLGGVRPVYSGQDMLADALAVLDAVGWADAHLVGGSMGAALAQALALLHPDRVRSLTCCMGAPATSGPLRTLTYVRPRVFGQFRHLSRDTDDQAQVDNLVRIFRAIASPGFPFPERWARETARLSHERCPRDPRTTQRHLAAGRTLKLPPLSEIRIPTLVISGLDDPLISPGGGRAIAAQVPGARFVGYPGMGHNLPEHLWPAILGELRGHTGSARVPAP